METIIEARNVVKLFDNSKTRALDGIDITIKEGEFLAVMGPSGSGKSTLLYSLSAMDTISQGQVIFLGKDLSKLDKNELADVRRQEMGFVFQYATMLKNLNILDNIVFPSLRDHKRLDEQRELVERAKELMNLLGIGGLENRGISQVSGGQVQRAGICRGLMGSPKIIFADEPTGSLNSKAAEEVLDIFEKINQEGLAILLVTHDPKVAARAKRLIIMKDGKLVEELWLGAYKKEEEEVRLRQIRDCMKRLGI